MNLKKRGQTWSFDLIIAVIVFIAVVAAFYAFLTSQQDDSSPLLLQDSARTIGRELNCDIGNSSNCLIVSGQLQDAQLNQLLSYTYDELKSQLDIDEEFCIYLRDNDGNLIDLNGKAGLGSDNFYLNSGILCNQALS